MKDTPENLQPAYEKVLAALEALSLPEVEQSTWYNTPSLRVRKKSLMRVKDADTLVFMCPLEIKELLMEEQPEIYFETDHYKGYGAILVRAANANEEILRECLIRAWRVQAPKILLKEHDRKC